MERLVALKITIDDSSELKGTMFRHTTMSDEQRQGLWAVTFELWTRKLPWSGLGINTINLQPGWEAPIPAARVLPMIPSHPHNWIIEILAETGVIGFIPLVVVIVIMFYQFTLRYLRDRNPAMLAAIATAAGFWGSGLFNFSFWSTWWQTSFVLMMVICWVVGSERRSGTPSGN